MRARLLAIVVLTWVAASAAANERLSIRVSPAVSFAPANLVVQTRVLADNANRSIEIVAESADFYRSSEMWLDGDQAPRTTRFEFKALPSGFYDVTAVLRGVSGNELAMVKSQVNVVEGGAMNR